MLDLHRRTLAHSVDVVRAIRDDQWDAPTPCLQWTVRQLVEHMVRENRGFAAAAAGETVDRSAWTSTVGPDPRAEYADSARRVIEAFGAADPDGTFLLPMIRDGITVPARQAISFHLLDYLVHGWDAAVAIGWPATFPADVVAAVGVIAEREVPDGPRRYRPDASFGPPVPMPADAPALDRLLGFLGRDPAWRPDLVSDFLATARRYGDRPAIVHNGRTLTYGTLAGRVRRFAAGVAPGVVGTPATHSPETVIGLLGTWLAGGVYCPVDPTFPQARRDAMLEAAGADEPAPEGIAYILFTSGSTGAPKPVLSPHRAIATTVRSLRRLFAITPDDRVLQFASLNWDTCFEEILPTLTSGACLVFDDDAYGGSFPRFLRMVERTGVTVLDLPTAYWHELVTYLRDSAVPLPACVRLVVIGGEAANPARVEEWRALDTGHARLLNTYGCTETTLITHAVDLHGPQGTVTAPGGPVPIGRALPHVVEKVTGDGELLIGGPALAAGYRGLPEATAARFVSVAGQRFFRTGDRVRRLPDGVLVHEGRIDNEVKVRGVRVDPAEVEAHIAGHPDVSAVLVTGVTVADHTALAAFVVPRQRTGSEGLPSHLVDYLRGRVPAHLIPSRIRVVADLVYTASGKVDRHRSKEALA